MIPTTIPSTNPFAILTDNTDEDEEQPTPSNDTHVALATTTTPTTTTYALSDSGASGHFLTQHAAVVNKQPATTPIAVTLPDGGTLLSTHTCNLDIPWLPPDVTQAHIFPGLTHSSLISTKKFCDAGYAVGFNRHLCAVFDANNKCVLHGPRDQLTQLWSLPTNPRRPPPARRTTTDNTTPTPIAPFVANNVHTIPHLQNRVKYMHQTFFCPPTQTLINAANLGFLDNMPFLTPELILKHLEKTPATAKGRMKLRSMGLRSTRCTTITKPTANNIFCFAALADKQHGTFYTDCTGNLPVRALDGQQLIFVAYDYDTNYIFAIPIDSTTSEDIMTAFRSVVETLTAHGYTPTFNVTDNQAATAIKQYCVSKNITVQLVEPHNHRVNAAERAIQTFKNHFISGLCATDANFPLQLWNHLVPQAVITCNTLRRSRTNPHISAYEQLHGKKYDWNAHPMAPPGTRAVIFNPPNLRTSWGPRALDAWYCGPSMDHYRCNIFYIPDSRSLRISGTYELYPTHCALPTMSEHEHTYTVFQELIRCIKPLPTPVRRTILNKIHQTINALATNTISPLGIRDNLPWPTQAATKGDDKTGTKGGQHTHHTTSTTPTAPNALRALPRIHGRHTRANIPPSNTAPIHVHNNMPTPTPAVEPTQPPTATTEPPNTIPTQLPTPRRSPRIALQSPRLYSNAALTAFAFHAFSTPSQTRTDPPTLDHHDEFCAPVIHPTTGATITKYKILQKDPLLRQLWEQAFGKEFGNLAQGDNATNTPGTNSIVVLTHAQIRTIPKDRTVTYTTIVVDFRPQKKDPNRVRLTAGGNLIDYPGELTTRTADLSTTKILWNSVISTIGARYLCLDIKNFYLGTPMDRFEYMKMPIDVFPQATIDQYDLHTHALNGFVYLEIRKAIYGLPQAGILANQLLRKRLRPHGYYEVAHTPGLWKHVTRPVQFTLTVDDFGVKYVGTEHANHLIHALRENYEVEEDWDGKLYCGITLNWDYEKRHVDISMPNYVTKLLERFNHPTPKRPQHSPHAAPPRQFGATAQEPVKHDTTPTLPPDRIKRIQQIVGTIMYYARAVDVTTLVALSSIAAEQSQATEQTEKHVHQLLDYLHTHQDATIRYVASDMILNIHSDASYLSEARARSRLGGTYFFGSLPQDGKAIFLNGPVHIHAGICKFVVASAAEAELGALFYNCQEGKILRLVLEELGHTQPATPVHCDNSTAVSIANDTVKKQRSRSMEMKFFWTTGQVAIGNFNVTWHPGQENLADYFTKHFDAKHHQNVRPWYLHMDNSPRLLPRALEPRTLKGCVGTLPGGYTRSAPLPRLRTGAAHSTTQIRSHGAPAHMATASIHRPSSRSSATVE